MAFDPDAAAAHLVAAHHTRKLHAPLPAALRPATLDQAYATQDAFFRRRVAERGPLAGWKVALTSPVMQRLVGFAHPLAGPLHGEHIHDSPTTLAVADFIHLGIECELAFKLAQDMPRPDEQGLAGALAAVAPAFELIEDRHADYAEFDALGVVADNCWNGGVVVGGFVPLKQLPDLDALTGRLFIDDRAAGEGSGRDVLGHPLNALAWLAQHCAGRGTPLRAGQIVMTGSMIATKFAMAGQRFRFVVDQLGEVDLAIA